MTAISRQLYDLTYAATEKACRAEAQDWEPDKIQPEDHYNLASLHASKFLGTKRVKFATAWPVAKQIAIELTAKHIGNYIAAVTIED